MFVLWVCLAAFNRVTPGVAAVVVGYATGYALTRRTLPLAGAGAVEALLPFALVWVGFGLAPTGLAASPTASSTSGYRSAPPPSGSTTYNGKPGRARARGAGRRSRS